MLLVCRSFYQQFAFSFSPTRLLQSNASINSNPKVTFCVHMMGWYIYKYIYDYGVGERNNESPAE